MITQAQHHTPGLWCSCCTATKVANRVARADAERVSAMPVKVRRLIKSVCRREGINPSAVLGDRKDRFAAAPRATLAKALRGLGYSYPVIGRWLGRDHSTVMTMVAGRKRP